MALLKNYKKSALRNMLFICVFFMISCKNGSSAGNYTQAKTKTVSIRIPEIYYGNFTANVETEATTTGMASISYHFFITKTGAKLRTTTLHEPIQCEGSYKGHFKNDILNLFYDGMEKNCKTEEPNFKIKKVDQKFFIQGLGGEATFNEWVELKKDN